MMKGIVMKLVEFLYTKENGTQSQRAVVEVQQPNKFFEGIDVSELDAEAFAQFAADYRVLKEDHHVKVLQCLNKHDLKNNYRRFAPERMTNTVSEYV